jgi:hypothetical protein
MKAVASCISRLNGKSMVFFVKSVVVRNSIGYKASGNGNVHNVSSERLYEVGRLWSLLSYLSTNGICVWRL